MSPVLTAEDGAPQWFSDHAFLPVGAATEWPTTSAACGQGRVESWALVRAAAAGTSLLRWRMCWSSIMPTRSASGSRLSSSSAAGSWAIVTEAPG